MHEITGSRAYTADMESSEFVEYRTCLHDINDNLNK